MKIQKLLFFIVAALIGLQATAQTMYIHQGSVTIAVPAASAGDILVSGGCTLMLGDKSYPSGAIDSITFDNAVVNEQLVAVKYNGSSASVTIPYSLTSVVSATVSKANVVVTSTASADPEVQYALSGTSTDGSFTLNGTYKCGVTLNGLNLTSNTGAAIDIENGKRIAVTLAEGTNNVLADYASGSQKACFYVKGHPEFSGAGTLTVTGNVGHGIAAKEYMEIKRTVGSITIAKAANDGIHCGQYFQMNGGTLTVSNTKGDCVQAEKTTNVTDVMNGQMLINGGTINLTVSSDDTKGLKSDSLMTIAGGTITMKISGNGSKGLSTGTNLILKTGETTPNITLTASGGKWTDPADANNTSKCMGAKIDGSFYAHAGTIKVTVSNANAKGIKVDGNYYHTSTVSISPTPEVGGTSSLITE